MKRKNTQLFEKRDILQDGVKENYTKERKKEKQTSARLVACVCNRSLW